MNYLEYKNDSLFFDGISLEDISKKIKTPFYIYSEESIKKNINDYLSEASSKSLFCYSVKANSNLTLLKLIASQGMGFDVVSKGELHRAIKAGANPKRIVYSGVGKTKEEIAYALNNKILCFNVESEEELYAINSQASLMKTKANISIRVNPDVKVETHPYISTGMKENKFGIAYEDALGIYQKAKKLDSIDIIGIDFEHIRFDERLKEITLGSRDGYSSWHALKKDFPEDMAKREKDPWNYRHPKGESSQMVLERIEPFMLELERLSGTHVVVAHGVVNKIFRGLYLSLTHSQIFALDRPQESFHCLSKGKVSAIEAL